MAVTNDSDEPNSEDEASAESEQPDSQGKKVPRPINFKVIGVAVVLVAVVAAAIVFSFRFVEDERARQMQAWQIRLGLVADSRVAAVNEWVERNFATLRELAENESLQLYLTELSDAEGDKEEVTDEPAQASYLRNLLIATAERTGFKAPVDAGEVAANVEKVGVAGLGLTDKDGRPIVSTPTMPPMVGKVRSTVAKALEGEPALLDIYMGASNLPTIGFALPIFAIQADEGAAGIGAAVGIRTVGKDLYDRLKQPGAIEATAETYLVRAAGGTVEYLSPLADGTAALKRALAKDTPDLAAAYALDNPGGFAIKRDYAGEEALVVSRPIANLPWVLVRKISYTEALEATDTRLKTILGVFVAIIVIVTITIIAVWRHGTSVRATEAAEKFRVSSLRFENMSKFMRVVTNSQPTNIVAVDGTTTYTFANQPSADQAGISTEEMLGKTMAGVMGPIKAKVYEKINAQILENFEEAEAEDPADSVQRVREQHIETFGEDEDLQVIKSDHIPLRGDRDYPPGVLMVLDDITELTRERRRSEQMMRQLINTLVSVVDRRDPFSAHHSTRVAEVSRCVAGDMDADALEVKTVDIAGSLMSVGKIFIPTEVLAKGDDLTDEERELLANSYRVSADLLQGVTFDGPVVDTIRQMGEHWDGTGPLGLAGENILRSARIVSVAAAFVDMVSARVHRDAMTFEEACKRLQADSGTAFDHGPVAALDNFLVNHGGAERWASFRDRPEGATA